MVFDIDRLCYPDERITAPFQLPDRFFHARIRREILFPFPGFSFSALRSHLLDRTALHLFFVVFFNRPDPFTSHACCSPAGSTEENPDSSFSGEHKLIAFRKNHIIECFLLFFITKMTAIWPARTTFSRSRLAGAAVTVLAMLSAIPVFAGSSISTAGYDIVKTDKGDASLTIYGRVSPGLRYSKRPADGSGGDHLALDSGTRGGDRFGLIGDIGLPMDLRTGFVLERGLSLDSGQGNTRWNRKAFAFLSHENLGKLSIGRVPTPQFRDIELYDPFEDAYDPLAANVYVFNARFDNALMYESPAWNGFSLTVGGSTDTAGNRTADRTPDPGNSQGFFFAPRYENGPFSTTVFLTYHKLKNDNGHPLAGADVFAFDLFAGYDFGTVNLTAMLGLREASERDFIMGSAINLNSQVTRTVQWLVGAKVPLFEKKGNVMAAYTGRRMSLAKEDSKAHSHMFSLGYAHVFNRYFRVYAGYAYIINNSTARTIAGAATVPGGPFQSLVTLGTSISF